MDKLSDELNRMDGYLQSSIEAVVEGQRAELAALRAEVQTEVQTMASLAQQNDELGRLSEEIETIAMAVRQRAEEPAANHTNAIKQQLEVKIAEQRAAVNESLSDIRSLVDAVDSRIQSSIEGAAEGQRADLLALRTELQREVQALAQQQRAAEADGSHLLRVEELEAKFSQQRTQLGMVRADVDTMAMAVHNHSRESAAPSSLAVQHLEVKMAEQQSALQESLRDLRSRVDAVDGSVRNIVEVQIAEQQSNVNESVSDLRRRLDAVDSHIQSSVEAMLGVHRAELGTLHAEVEAMLLAKITEQQAILEDSLRKIDKLSTEVNSVDVQSSFEAMLTELRGEVGRMMSEREVISPMAVQQQPATLPDIERLQDGLKQLEEIRHSLEEALQTEARTRADEDRRVERACNLDLKAGLGVLAREINSHAAGLDEVRKNIGFEREERINRQQELSGTVHDSLQAMISKLDIMTPTSSTGCISNPMLLVSSPRGSLTGGLKSSTSAGGLMSGQSTPRVSDRGHAFVSQIDSMGASVRSPRRQSRQASPSQQTRGISLSGSNHVRGTSARARTPSVESRAASVESRRIVSQGPPRHPTAENGLTTNSNHTSSQVLQMIDALQEEVLLRRQLEAGRQSVGRQPNKVVPQGRSFPAGKLLGSGTL